MSTLEFFGNGAGKAVLVCGLLSLALLANAEWTVVRLNPQGSGGSEALGVGGGQQVGYTQINTASGASLWTGTPGTYVNLHPFTNDGTSSAYDTDGAVQVGYVAHPTYGGKAHAALWQGTAASYLDLNPTGSTESYAFGNATGVQVGRARFSNVVHAGLWTGSASSWVDLQPSSATSSEALGTGDGQQVGMATINGVQRAGLWSGTAESWIDLNPAGASRSSASSVSHGRQVGSANILGVNRPGYWTGSAQSWVDLSQLGWTNGAARGAWNDLQVGIAGIGGIGHASLWRGTAESWVDLHSYLPGNFRSSRADAVWQSGEQTYVVGWGDNLDNGEAILWISNTVPELNSGLLFSVGLGFLVWPLVKNGRFG